MCKFAAIASKVNIEVFKEPEIEAVKPAAAKKERRQSQFSLMVMDKKSKESLLTGKDAEYVNCLILGNTRVSTGNHDLFHFVLKNRLYL